MKEKIKKLHVLDALHGRKKNAGNSKLCLNFITVAPIGRGGTIVSTALLPEV